MSDFALPLHASGAAARWSHQFDVVLAHIYGPPERNMTRAWNTDSLMCEVFRTLPPSFLPDRAAVEAAAKWADTMVHLQRVQTSLQRELKILGATRHD